MKVSTETTKTTDATLSATIVTILGLMIWLQIKHFICDYPLQTHYQLVNKGTYGHPGGILHSGIHVAGTAFIFGVITPTLGIALLIVVGEFLVHYHLDWAKSQVMRATGWQTSEAPFWWAIGADQLGHHLTYVGIIAILAGTTL